MAKQGEVTKITSEHEPEFKGEGEEVKKEAKVKTSILTMQGGKPTRIYFENGKQVRSEVAQ